MSIPFTWLLPEAKAIIEQRSFLWNKVIVGGPAIKLLPNYFSNEYVKQKDYYPGILQKINSKATRTTIGCPNRCSFCGVSKIEPEYIELEKWPDRPIIMDNNILACSNKHFEKVCDRLEKYDYCDFNQGIDIRLLNEFHIERFKKINNLIIRLALDNENLMDIWENAFQLLRKNKIKKHNIFSYCLIGFNDNPEKAWKKCKFIEKHGVHVLPMWFHELDTLKLNVVTDQQLKRGWNDFERRKIMQWYYHHKKAVN
jgi:hypothetical protein